MMSVRSMSSTITYDILRKFRKGQKESPRSDRSKYLAAVLQFINPVLMEMALRLLGIEEAIYTQLKASNSTTVPQENGNNDPKCEFITRTCPTHGTEWLWMYFGTEGQWGEACCVADGRYYPCGFGTPALRPLASAVIGDSPIDVLRRLSNNNIMTQWWCWEPFENLKHEQEPVP